MPVTIIGYFLINNLTYKNTWLLIMSLVFFGWSQPGYLWIIFLSILINYLGAYAAFVAEARSKVAKRAVLFAAIAANLSLLYYFKYFDFTIQTINSIGHTEIPLKNIILPIGISFFTFQGMSYVIDVYRGEVPVQKNPFKVALYIVLFPQLIAGPIVRYTDIANEIGSRKTTISDLSSGITRFVIGLGKKAIIANTMAEVADGIWNGDIAGNTVLIAWLGSIAYSLQIFYDFSGYSDMAIGLGRVFGFHFIENFNRPYISRSISEFWRRWHISLSTWFRDYVYIPLGGNRKHLYRNLWTIFFLTGLWHGASWHFVIWGLWNGLFMVIERRFRKRLMSEDVSVPKRILQHIYALFIINIGWVLFRADTLYMALKYIGTMFGVGLSKTPGFTIFWHLNWWVVFVLVIAVIDITGGFIRLKDGVFRKISTPALYKTAKAVAIYGILILSVMRIMSGTYNPFIYFQF
ncbi:MBOAT family O-acyltransferase [Butyrivibrio sp. AE3004]|uniref:MBOAT family O-acyltransferase n=1 Tax=Butyrivibrio sp. AE3004 TaxID=1506994 RepID=UPI001FA71BBB|nr:MBOAT family O-acyltransferase [Butyrivibrio sp. AE3004]